MFVYVTCRPNIGYAVTTLSKFSTCPTKLHYKYLRGIVTYLQHTKNWGIRYHRTCPAKDYHHDLPHGNFDDPPPPLPDDFPPFPEANPEELTCYVDAAYANDLRKRRSTTGYAITLAGGAIFYRSKTQSVTALSSTEAEFFAAIAASKVVLFLRFVLEDLTYPMNNPTPIYENNESCIKIINARKPTDRVKHLEVPYFRIQDWKEDGYLLMRHIPGILSPPDSLTKPLG